MPSPCCYTRTGEEKTVLRVLMVVIRWSFPDTRCCLWEMNPCRISYSFCISLSDVTRVMMCHLQFISSAFLTLSHHIINPTVCNRQPSWEQRSPNFPHLAKRQRWFVNVAACVLGLVTFQDQAFPAPSQLTLPKAGTRGQTWPCSPAESSQGCSLLVRGCAMLCCPWIPIPGENNVNTSPSHSFQFKTGLESALLGRTITQLSVLNAKKDKNRGWEWDTASFSSRRLGLTQPAIHGWRMHALTRKEPTD